MALLLTLVSFQLNIIVNGKKHKFNAYRYESSQNLLRLKVELVKGDSYKLL